METMRFSEDVPVVGDVDICVLGGSCTGVFAAVRAARLGARVAVVEKLGAFGGVAVSTCTWHSLRDTQHDRVIIGGLTREVLDRMASRDAVTVIPRNASKGYIFRPGELKRVLDELVIESGITPHLHTFFSAPVMQEDRLVGVVVESKSGRGIILAREFVDATGDADLCFRLGLETFRYEALLPPTTCAFLARWSDETGVNVGALIREHGDEVDLAAGFVWGVRLPGTDSYMLAGTRVVDVDCSVARDLTRAEIEGRRQVGAITDLLRRYHPKVGARLLDFPASIGIRDTRHIRGLYQLSGRDILEGVRFDDAIANGSYCVDIHHQDRPGVTMMYLDGRQGYAEPGCPNRPGRWREERAENPTFYQVPLRALIPAGAENIVAAGRMVDADVMAFGAARVMVNTNQMGEAAGVTAWAALNDGVSIPRLPAGRVRQLLAEGGSLVL